MASLPPSQPVSGGRQPSPAPSNAHNNNSNDDGEENRKRKADEVSLDEEEAKEKLIELVHPSTFDEVDHTPAGRTRRGQQLKELLENHPDVCRVDGDTIVTALKGHASIEILEPLIAFAPESLLTTLEREGGRTPLGMACTMRDEDFALEVYELLITPESARVPAQARCPSLPILDYFFARKSNLEVIRLLVQAYPEGVEVVYGNNIGNLFHCAVLDRFFEWDVDSPTLRYLAELWPQGLMTPNFMQWTPLHVACANNCTDALHSLVELCPESLQMQDDQGRIPLHVALECFNTPYCRSRWRVHVRLEAVQSLAGRFSEGIYMPNNNGVTPLEYACEQDMDLDFVYELVMVDPVAAVAWLSGRGGDTGNS